MEYIQYTNPNPIELKDLINRAKGDRTMIMFADDIKRSFPNIKVSSATLSRACNITDGKPVSLKLLKAIADVADKDSGVTFEALIAANGMRSKEKDDSLSLGELLTKQMEVVAEKEKKLNMLLQDEIIKRGYAVQVLNGLMRGRNLHTYRSQIDRMFPRNYTVGFNVSGMSPCSTWKFSFTVTALPEDSADNAIEAHVGSYINRVGAVFASDAFEYERYESEKYSFVFVDRKMYDAFLKRISDNDIAVNGLMTAILVDLDANAVIEEKQIPRQDGEEAMSFFKEPVVTEADETDLLDPYDVIED